MSMSMSGQANVGGGALPRPAHRRRVLEVAQWLSAALGADFFQGLVQHLAEALAADCAYVGELMPARQEWVRSLAVYRKDGEPRGFEHGLSGTAPGRVLVDGLHACRKDAAKAFPLDSLLTSIGAKGYAGIRLCDSAGQPIGVLAIASRQQLRDIRLTNALLETFAPRTAAELERKRAEDVHRENEERYRAFVLANPDAMWRIEFAEPIPITLGEDEQIERMYRFGYVAECNDALALQLGASRAEELIGTPLADFGSRRDVNVREELRASVRSRFRHLGVEFVDRNASGRPAYRLRSEFGIVENGALRRVWVTIRDITELRQAEFSLVAAERRFREVLEGVQLPAIMVDPRGAITFANECFLGLSQRSKEELSALRWLEGIIPAEESATWQQILRQAQSRQQATAQFEGAITQRDGPHRTIQWSTIALRERDESLGGIAAIGRDVTWQRALEVEVRQAQRMDGIGRLAAGVGHDFNNLITVIAGHTALLLEQISESDPKRPHLIAIEEAVRLCTTLTRQLLGFGRRQRLNPEFFMLNQVVASAETLIRGLTGAGIEVHFDLQPATWRVYADPAQITQALVNLVTNARDAMPQGGRLTIKTSNLVVRADDVAYPAVKPGNYVRLSVSDTGIGMTEDVKSHIFEPFFTTKPAGKGSGVGLAIVYGLVTQSGGQILVHSEPGKGATFEIVLPASEGTLNS